MSRSLRNILPIIIMALSSGTYGSNVWAGNENVQDKVFKVKMKPPASRYTLEAAPMTLDDLSIAPRKYYLNGVPQINLFNFIWGTPVFMDQPRDEWGQQISNDPQLGVMNIWSPAIRASVGNIVMEGNPDVFSPANITDLGYIGPIVMKKVPGDPEDTSGDDYNYLVTSPAKKMSYRFSTKQIHMKTKDLNLTSELMPYCFHMEPIYAMQVAYFHGTYKNKPVEFFGGMDRGYGSEILKGIATWKRSIAVFAGRGVDGKWEYGYILIAWNMDPSVGKSFTAGFYQKEGEDPVVSDDVKIKNITWGKSPNKDKAILPLDATYTFGGKEINVQAKLGAVGFSSKNGALKPILKAVSAVNASTVRDFVANGVWKEKDSVNFDLTFVAIETELLTPHDVGLE